MMLQLVSQWLSHTHGTRKHRSEKNKGGVIIIFDMEVAA